MAWAEACQVSVLYTTTLISPSCGLGLDGDSGGTRITVKVTGIDNSGLAGSLEATLIWSK